ncbi:MAG: hypothetical protein WBA10_00865 [Elainellaceae cyanobacterium]
MQRVALIGVIATVGVTSNIIAAPMARAGLFGFELGDLINAGGSVNAGDYSDCASDLQEAGIEPAKAADVCASAFDPDEIADCVTDIQGDTTLIADAALSGCLRVRRPDELSDCVVDVDRAFEAALPYDALAYCTRSLLPERFSDCVTGLEASVDIDPRRIMNYCVEGDYVVTDLFIPGIDSAEVLSPDISMPEVDLDSIAPRREVP